MLSPYRIVDLTDERGALAGLLLAQLGADVVLVEPERGNRARRVSPTIAGTGAWHLAQHRGKRSVRLGAVDLDALLASADVVLDNGAFDRASVDLPAWRERHPHLVTVSVSAFGSDGPKASWPATDLTVLASGCQLALTGDADRAPVRISVPQAFQHAASEAAVGALVALHRRAQCGQGSHVDVSAQQCVLQATQTSVLAAAVGAAPYQRTAGGIAVGPYNLRFVYPAADGHVSITFLFGAMVGPFTARLMQWVHEEGFCSAELAGVDWPGLFVQIFSGALAPTILDDAAAAVSAFTATRTKAELLAEAMRRKLLIAPVASTADVLASEQLAARGFWDRIELGDREIAAPGPAARSSVPLRRLGRAPHLGEHEAELAAELAVPELRRATAGSTDPGRLPFEGLKVLDLSWAVAAPMATRVLADWGATVIRVESEGRIDAIRTAGPYLAGSANGLEDTAQWQSVNAGKLGLQLDLSVPEAKAVVLDLAGWADVVIESFSPGVLERLGLAPADLQVHNPSLITVSSCLMGQTGPMATMAGFGNLAGAISGFYEVTGWADRPPAGPFLAYTDYVAPRATAAVLLAALDHRRRTGEAASIDLAQQEAALQFLAPALIATAAGRGPARRIGNDDPDLAPHGVYPCLGEDRWVAIACQDDDAWRALAELVGRPALGALGANDRVFGRRELDTVVTAWTSTQSAEAVEAACIAAGVAAHRVQNSPECVADPQLAHRRHFRAVPHRLHPNAVVEGPHFTVSGLDGGPRRAGPTLGEHNDVVLREILGYNDDRVVGLLVAGAIR